MTVFTSGSCLNPLILPHADKYPKHFKTLEAFSQVFEPNALRKQFQNKAELILDASRGHFKSRGSKDSVQYFTLRGLSQLAAEFLDPTVRGRWSARIRMRSLHEQLTHFNWMQLFIVFSWCNKIFLFIISYIKYKTRIFVWIQTLQSSTWPFFQMPVVTKKAWRWLVATSNSKPVKDTGRTRMLKMTSTLQMPQTMYVITGTFLNLMRPTENLR